MKVAILGGGFNPPHLGHLHICKQVLAFTDVEEVWLLPYFAHPWEKPSLDPKHRLSMCRIMANDKIKVSDIEIKLKKKNYTFESIDLLIKKFPQHKFSWIIGSDLYKEFFTWENVKKMIKKVKILVFPRAGWPVGKLPTNFYTIENKILTTSDIASEKIREMVRRGISITGMVLPGVEEYIKKHKLYL